MGMTLIEKIISSHAGLESVEPGQRTTVEVDRFLLGEEDFYCVLEEAQRQGDEKPGTPGKIVVALDQSAGAFEGDRQEEIRLIKAYRKSWHIHQLYGLGTGGIETVIFPDGGFVRPGDLLVGGNPQLLSFGALGALALNMKGESLYQAIMEGRLSLEVPETIRLVFRGNLNSWVGGKDLALMALGLLGDDTVSGKALLFSGEAVEALEIADRLALGAVASNLGACCVLIEPDEKTRVFARARCDRSFHPLEGDEDASYSDIIEIDVETIEPQVGILSRPEKVLGVSKVKNTKIDQVVIGTGGNGRIEDIRIAASLLREYQINRSVRLIIIPGSQQVFLHAMEEGLMQIFLRAGAHIGPPSRLYANQCHLRAMGPEERCLSTSGTMYPEENLSACGEMLYCNPALAAASTVLGHVADPFEMMRFVKRKPTGLMG